MAWSSHCPPLGPSVPVCAMRAECSDIFKPFVTCDWRKDGGGAGDYAVMLSFPREMESCLEFRGSDGGRGIRGMERVRWAGRKTDSEPGLCH